MQDSPENKRFFEGPRFIAWLRNGPEEGGYPREIKAVHEIIQEFIHSKVYSNNGIDGQPVVFKPIVKKLCGVKKLMRSCLVLKQAC
jgi:hypothetical protein